MEGAGDTVGTEPSAERAAGRSKRPAHPARASRRRWAEDALHVVVASSFAVAQPLFDLLGRNPTFFVAHGSSTRDIVLLACLVLLGPPVVVLAAEWAIGRVSRRARELFHTAAVGGLVALAVAPPIYRGLGASAMWALALLLATTTAAALLYRRIRAARLFLSFASPAPLVFLALFLLASPVRHLVLPSSPEAHVIVARTETPVVLVVFDEMALFSILGPDGEINAERFPNIERLAATSVWYPNATTVHEHSNVAISSLLSGTIAPHRSTPTPAEFPDTLFTLLGGSYDLNVHEQITELCPSELCERARPERRVGTLLEDTGIAFLHTVFTDDAARRWLPPVDDQWAGFRNDHADPAPKGGEAATDPATAAGDGEEHAADELARFRSFVASLDGSAPGPRLEYLHVLLPHRPWQYLADGSVYPWDNLEDLRTEDRRRWVDDQNAANVGLQQYLLQATFVDRLVGELLDRLEDEDLLDQALLIVTADHGISFQAGKSHRFVAEDAPPSDIIPVPLFVKLPGQGEPVVDDRNAELVDIVPTVADVIGTELPFETDGVSLIDEAPDRPATRVRWQDDILEYPQSFLSEVEETARDVDALFGSGEDRFDLFGNGEHRAIIGRDVSDLRTSSPSPAEGSANIDDADAMTGGADDGHDGALIPAQVTGSVPDRPSGTSVAVAIDGVVAGVAPAYVNEQGANRFSVIVYPELLVDARTIAVYAVEGPPSDPLLVPLVDG